MSTDTITLAKLSRWDNAYSTDSDPIRDLEEVAAPGAVARIPRRAWRAFREHPVVIDRYCRSDRPLVREWSFLWGLVRRVREVRESLEERVARDLRLKRIEIVEEDGPVRVGKSEIRNVVEDA